jgi:hypothetical protein
VWRLQTLASYIWQLVQSKQKLLRRLLTGISYRDYLTGIIIPVRTSLLAYAFGLLSKLKNVCVSFSMERVQVQKEQIDKRIVTAIIRAVAERGSFVVRYRDVYEQLDKLVEDDDEFYKLEDKMYEAVSEGLLRGSTSSPGLAETATATLSWCRLSR